MIEIQQITSSSDPYFKEIIELYFDSFPASERRDIEFFKSILEQEVRFNVNVIMKDSGFLGFITHWEFEQFYYIEHFAIDKSQRGKNIGSKTIEYLLSVVDRPIILEVEMPDSDEAVRRIKFYERLGLKVISKPYVQPFYDGSDKVLPMFIMSNSSDFADKNFETIKDTLHREVYKKN